jgi:IS4 transposase
MISLNFKLRKKLIISFFNEMFKKVKTFRRYRLIAIDGSKVNIPTNSKDDETYTISNENSKEFNLLHVNALYDIFNKFYLDAKIQTYKRANEFKVLIAMISRLILKEKTILIVDRGYKSYHNIARLVSKGWNYVIRVKAPNNGAGLLSNTDLPVNKEFDEVVSVLMTRKQTNEIKSNPKLYRLIIKVSIFDFSPLTSKDVHRISFRVVCVIIEENSYQCLITNLDDQEFQINDLKYIYRKRWHRNIV